MSGEMDKSQYILPLDQPVAYLEAITAFQGLTNKEKHYAYHIAKASWIGGLITFVQISSESPEIFILLHKFYSSLPPGEVRTKAVAAGFTEDNVTAVFVYSSGLFANAGNYKGFGDTKFIPGIEPATFCGILKLSPIWAELEPLWNKVQPEMYDLSEGKHCLGYPPHGCTTYLSKNCTAEDSEKVKKWAKSKKMEFYNTRLFKVESNGKIKYIIKLAGQSTGVVMTEEVDGIIYEVVKGDYSSLMSYVADSLESAIEFSANDAQKKMLNEYCISFRDCSIDAHKDGSRHWVQDKGPAVESFIGFIETYRDPAGVRGEFEGFVAAVNREMSAKFAILVENAEKFLTLLPWGADFEKDKFLRPDFTSLDVLAFAGSCIPAGINIPNYDEIRQNEGFKNVSLGNVIPASYQLNTIPFLSTEDKDLLKKYRVLSFEVQVGLHELLGHGSGKLLRKLADGSFNFPSSLRNPLTGEPITKYYEEGETSDSIFGSMYNPFEECRAEAVGLFLSLEPTIVKIFGYEGPEADDLVYVNWLSLVWSGLGSLEMWDPNRGWLQSHSQARFALMRVLIDAGVVEVRQPSDTELILSLDRQTFPTVGRKAIGHFLLQMQVYKSTADYEAAKQLFDGLTNVGEPWGKWREIVLANKRPRRLFIQPNMRKEGEEVVMKNYESSLEGLIHSWVDRFDQPEKLYEALHLISKEDAPHF